MRLAVPTSAARIRFATLWRREVNRFMKIKKQTIGAPLLETFLYISVFGAALGSRIDKLHGIDYVVFVIPGLSEDLSSENHHGVRAENPLIPGPPQDGPGLFFRKHKGGSAGGARRSVFLHMAGYGAKGQAHLPEQPLSPG